MFVQDEVGIIWYISIFVLFILLDSVIIHLCNFSLWSLGVPWNSLDLSPGSFPKILRGEILFQVLTIVNGEIMGRTFAAWSHIHWSLLMMIYIYIYWYIYICINIWIAFDVDYATLGHDCQSCWMMINPLWYWMVFNPSLLVLWPMLTKVNTGWGI